MLRLVLGRSKSGKTEYIQRVLADMARGGSDKLLIIVPDQQSFDTEKAFLELLGPALSRRVTVLGFSRLCNHIFDKTGYRRGVFSDDATLALLMSVALEECADRMRVYGNKWDDTRLVSMMIQLRKELRRNNCKPEIISSVTRDADELLRDKLSDISLVLSTFDALFEKSFSDAEDELIKACELLCEHRLFEGYTVCIDSYLSFTEPELMMIEELTVESGDIYITLADDGMNDDDSIFEASRDTARRLRAIAADRSVAVARAVMCAYDGYFKGKGIAYLEENIFRSDSLPVGGLTYDDVTVYAAKDIYDEADAVACNIRRLLIEEGARYSDIAVVMRGGAEYSGIIEQTFQSYDISYFADAPRGIMSSPLMKLVCAIFDALHSSFDKDAVLSLVKSGLVNADRIDVALFENYLFTWSLSGKRLLSEFKQNPGGFTDRVGSAELETLGRIENVRRTVIDPLVKFREDIKDADVSVLCRSLYELLEIFGVRDRINALCDELDDRGEHRLGEEQIKLWDVFIETLDRFVTAIGDRRLSSRRFIELLKLQLSNLEIAFIPRALDQVTVGDIERLRLSDKKYIFVIGAVKGEFPRDMITSGLLTLSERNILSELGVLSESLAEYHSLREKYLCYYALTGASHKLWISYPASTLKAEEQTPSVMVTEVLRLLGLRTVSYADMSRSTADRVWAAKPAYRTYCGRIGSTDRLTVSLEEYYESRGDYASSLSAIRSARRRDPFRMREKDSPALLYGSDMRISASQIERYHLCRFMYFMEYGLRIRELRKAEIDAMEYGTFVHHILEMFIKKFDKETACGLGEGDVRREIEVIIDEYAKVHFGDAEEHSPRFKYLYRRVISSATLLIMHIIDELRQSSFTPAAFELGIGSDVPAYELEVAEGLRVTVCGKIDRVDIMEQNDKKYIRVVDYKTGTKVFDLSDVMYGLNLQMLLYLSVLCRVDNDKFGADALPAGVLYMPAIAPVVNAAFDASLDYVIAERNKNLRMNGLILDDIDVLTAMDKKLGGLYIPVSQGKAELKGTDNLASLEEFGAIFSKIDGIISRMAEELHSGSAEATPATGRYDACKYCPYLPVCGHNEFDPVRNIALMDKENILDELGMNTEEVQDNGQSMDR